MTNALAILTALTLSGCTVSLTGHVEVSATFAHGLQGEANGAVHVTPIPTLVDYYVRREMLRQGGK